MGYCLILTHAGMGVYPTLTHAGKDFGPILTHAGMGVGPISTHAENYCQIRMQNGMHRPSTFNFCWVKNLHNAGHDRRRLLNVGALQPTFSFFV